MHDILVRYEVLYHDTNEMYLVGYDGKHIRLCRNISETMKKHNSIILDLLQTHTLTGWDTVASCFRIGKATGLKVLITGEYTNHECDDVV